MSLGEIAYEAYHEALREYRHAHNDQFDQSGRWASLSPQFQAAWEGLSGSNGAKKYANASSLLDTFVVTAVPTRMTCQFGSRPYPT